MSFPVLATDEETKKEMLSTLPNMLVKPTFSVRNAVSDHRLPLGGSLTLLAVGLAGLVGTIWQVRKPQPPTERLSN